MDDNSPKSGSCKSSYPMIFINKDEKKVCFPNTIFPMHFISSHQPFLWHAPEIKPVHR